MREPPAVASRRPWDRLAIRLGLGLCLGAAAILVGAAAWNVRTQRQRMTELVRMSGERSAEIIRSAAREAMLHDNPGELRRILESIGAGGTVERIRVFDKQGRVRVSTDPAEIDTLVGTDAAQCAACHAPGRPREHLRPDERMREYPRADGARVLGVIAPIPNEPACSSGPCHVHPGSQRVLGVLDVQLSLAGVDAAVARSERQLLAGALGTVLGLLGLSWLLTWAMVLRPVRRLRLAAARVAGGDLGARLPGASRHEIGEVSRSWNAMLEELVRARDELESWGHSLERRVAEKTRELEGAHQRMLLVEKMASLGKLAAVVAHEINNPLAGITTYARLLRRRAAGDEEAARILRLIEEESARCGNIVRNLLLFSRAPGARFSEQDLNPLLERCRLLLNHQAELKGVELGVDAGEGLPRVTCDPSQIQQLLVALAMNAIEATPAGGRVLLRARPEGDGIALEVADTGRGIPGEDLPRIFEPFFSTKEKGTGVGLGLAVAYGIVRRHRGTIDVRSEPGAGTTFRIVLPLRQPEPAEPEEILVGVS
jgi:two-component system NtrC family sensor kinase